MTMRLKFLVSAVSVLLPAFVSCNQNQNLEDSEISLNKVIEPVTDKLDLSGFSKVIYVVDNNNGGDGSKQNPFGKIQEAIDASEGNTAVLVAGGDSVTSIRLKNNIHLFGGYNPENWERNIEKFPSVIDAFGKSRIFIAAENNVIDGFVIRNGRVRGNGAAVLCDGVSPRISNNYLVRNRTLGPEPWNPEYWHETANDGGAVYCTNGASPVIENNVFTQNSTVNGRGAAIAADGKCKPVIRNNVFFDNLAGMDDPMRSSDGGAVSVFDWCDAVIDGNLFISNTAESKNDGGGVFIALWSSAAVTGNLFVDNHAGDDAGALFVGGQEHRYGGVPLDPIPPKDKFFVSIKDNKFIGNHHGGVNSGAMRFTMESRGEFVNNILAQNNGVYFQRSEVRVAGNIILDNFLFIETKDGLEQGIIENNLIWADYDQQVEATVRNNNMLEPVAGNGNYSKEPDFDADGMELNSIASVFNRSLFTTTALTSQQLQVNELANRAVNVEGKWTVIKSNTENSITVWGNFMGKIKYIVAPTYTLIN